MSYDVVKFISTVCCDNEKNPTYRVLMPQCQPQQEQRCTEKWTYADCGAEPSPAKIIISHRIIDNEQKIGIFQQLQWFVK